MRVDFIKMHGLGNDFVVLDGRAQTLPEIDAPLARAVADRQTGIGCDQLVVLGRAAEADFAMRIFNADGGEVEACGNATRAVGLLHGAPATIAAAGRLLRVMPDADGIAVDMGVPRFEWSDIPLAYAMDTLAMPVAWEGLENPVAVNVGNPHAVFFVADCNATPLDRLGPAIEHDPLFPERVNVNVATVTARDAIRLRVWERGAGLTRACGTGACATAVAAIMTRRAGSPVKVTMPGGTLTIAWAPGQPIRMRGTATHVYSGELDLDALQ